MMIIPSADASNAFSLLAIIADPKAAKAKLDEITKAAQDLDDKNNQFADLTVREKNVTAKEQELSDKFAEAQNQLEIATNMQDSLTKAKNEFETNKGVNFNQQRDQQEQLNIREKYLDQREKDLLARESVVDSNTAATAAKLKEAEDLRAELANKIAQIKAIA